MTGAVYTNTTEKTKIYIIYMNQSIYAQFVKLTVTTLPMATKNYPLETYFVLPGIILGDQLP